MHQSNYQSFSRIEDFYTGFRNAFKRSFAVLGKEEWLETEEVTSRLTRYRLFPYGKLPRFTMVT